MKVNLGDEEPGSLATPARGRHIGKRALRNKSLTVSFDEKDLTDFVTGFHKRKKKRRKEAQKQQEEAMRRKRIEARKKRKLEELMVSGQGQDNENGEAKDGEEEDAEDEESEPDASASGTTMYDTGELKITVTTSEISREEEEPVRKENTQSTESGSTARASSEQPVPVRKSKPMKQSRKRSGTKTMKKREKKKQARGIKTSR
ncbi:PREDICTED: ribosomal RNA-processing protein 17-like [Camelina sativa]|uniref:Ribosomal RNA-processing protein 17-like n=1 Tax=Camelina sativa TaxID=90675 RepID=A0ABM0XXT3_CAMSA|nr:PREDICTED: ribosomal RNA-processing protein 17-like [Camelina sativa]